MRLRIEQLDKTVKALQEVVTGLTEGHYIAGGEAFCIVRQQDLDQLELSPSKRRMEHERRNNARRRSRKISTRSRKGRESRQKLAISFAQRSLNSPIASSRETHPRS